MPADVMKGAFARHNKTFELCVLRDHETIQNGLLSMGVSIRCLMRSARSLSELKIGGPACMHLRIRQMLS
jgi:hypothetical protein